MADSKTVTFIHAADVHLGAPFKGLRSLSPEWAEKVQRAIPEAFRRVIRECLADDVDFVVFPGDLFDTFRPSYADFSLFIEGMRRLEAAGKPVYLCHGNHDPYVTWQSEFALLPANCHRFSAQGPSFFTYKRDGEPLAIIGGRSYYNAVFPANEDISSGISREEAYQAEGVVVPFVVGVLHSGLDIDPTRSPVSPRVLNSRGVDYWALGHIHNRLLYPEDHPTIAFSGAPQARATKETGPHGILKVTLEEGKANQARFIDTAPVEWQRFTVDVSDCLTVSEIQETITNRQFKMNGDSHSQDMIFRVKLEGRTPLHGKLTSAVLEQMRTLINEGFPFFYLDAIIDRTSPQTDEDALRREGLFPAVFLSALEDELANPDELLATLEEDFQQLGFAMPTSTKRNLAKRAAESRTLVLDLLDRGERE